MVVSPGTAWEGTRCTSSCRAGAAGQPQQGCREDHRLGRLGRGRGQGGASNLTEENTWPPGGSLQHVSLRSWPDVALRLDSCQGFIEKHPLRDSAGSRTGRREARRLQFPPVQPSPVPAEITLLTASVSGLSREARELGLQPLHVQPRQRGARQPQALWSPKFKGFSKKEKQVPAGGDNGYRGSEGICAEHGVSAA